MNVLNETKVVVRDAPVWVCVSMFIFSMGLLFLMHASAKLIEGLEGFEAFIVFSYIIAVFYILCVLMIDITFLTNKKEVTQYEVTFDEGYTADAKELLSKYKLVGKRGEIYILQSIETEE